jgi:predicted phosphodiesterase
MIRKRDKRLLQTIAYVFSALVVMSMVLSLLEPVLFREPATPTPTWPPTWTPTVLHTRTPTVPPTNTVQVTTPSPSPTWTPTPTLTTTSQSLQGSIGALPMGTPTAGPSSTATPLTAVDGLTMVARLPTPSAPLTPAADHLTFAVCGDSRDDDAIYKKVLARVAQDGNAFLINTGDLVNTGSQDNFQHFQQLMADFPLPFRPVPGNHDRGLGGSLDHYLSYSGAPAAHYSFDAGPVHLTMANSASGGLDQAELDWIDQDLATTDRAVKMVFLHHPPFDPDGTNHILGSGNAAFMALAQKHQVAYVFAGHIHAYSQAERDGTTYVITGGAGAPLYTAGHPGAMYHYIQVKVEGTQVSTEVVPIT